MPALFLLAVTAAWAAPRVASPPPIHVYFFTTPICPSCTKAHNLLARMTKGDPQIKLHTLDVYEPRDYELAAALLAVAGISSKELPIGPAVLVGHTYLDRSHFSRAGVRKMLAAYRASGAPDMTAAAMPLRGHASESLPQQLRRWGLWPLLVAGLLDGINPCAFATLIFFLTYLGIMGTRGWPLAAVGLTFAAGVYVAYFAFGFGLLHALWALNSLPLLRRGLFVAMAGVSLVFAGLSWRDYRRLAAGNFAGVTLQLPRSLKQQTHALIRHGVRARWIWGVGFVLGLGVAALELACTGQVYVPALIYMVSLSATRATGVGWLLLYDLMFVTPILVLLAVILRGTSMQRLRDLAERQAGRTKLFMAIFFLLCGVYFALKAIMP